jgi:transposase
LAEKPYNLNEQHLKWFLSEETLRAQIGMSLEHRVAQFMHRFPGKKISATTLGNLYAKHKVRRKKIKVTKLANTRLRRRIEKQSQHMSQQLEEMRSRGFRLVFVDETMVTKSTMPTLEWSAVNTRYKVDLSQYGNVSIAVLAGVSQERGVDLAMIFPKSVNIPKFKVWLEELRARHLFDDICIVMDNLAVHHSREVVQRMDELGFEYVFTPAYSPDLNPIEFVFSFFKGQLKKDRFRSIQHGYPLDLRARILEIWGGMEREKIIGCIRHVFS